MNPEIMKKMGFKKELDLIERGYCPFCKQKINSTGFRDPLSAKEFEISGLCQKCQDETFAK